MKRSANVCLIRFRWLGFHRIGVHCGPHARGPVPPTSRAEGAPGWGHVSTSVGPTVDPFPMYPPTWILSSIHGRDGTVCHDFDAFRRLHTYQQQILLVMSSKVKCWLRCWLRRSNANPRRAEIQRPTLTSQTRSAIDFPSATKIAQRAGRYKIKVHRALIVLD